MTIDELIYLARNNDEFAINELINTYKDTLKIIINKYYYTAQKYSLDYNDLYQESLLALFKTIRVYDESKNIKFNTLLNVIVNRSLQDLLKINNRKKDNILNNALSLDDEEINLYNKVSSSSNIIDNIINDEIEKTLHLNLTTEETKVYELKKDGRCNKDISIILDKPYKNIINTISRIKNKLMNID